MSVDHIMTFGEAQEFLKLGARPFDFPAAKDCRSAINQLEKYYGHQLGKRGLSHTPVTMQAIDKIEKKIEEIPAESPKERRKRKNILTRLRKLARVVANAPKSTTEWDTLTLCIKNISSADGWPEKKLIPIVSTLKSFALEDSLEPGELTTDWLITRMRTTTDKRRESLRRAADLLDKMYDRLPPKVRPGLKFGDLADIGGGHRRSGELPPAIEDELRSYVMSRTLGTCVEGLREDKMISLGDAIKPPSTTIYVQALKWYFDSLRVAGILPYDAIPNSIGEISRLDFLSKVAFQALDDYENFENDQPIFLPWDPIAPGTIENRVYALRAIFGRFNSQFEGQTIPRLSGGANNEPLTVGGFCKYVSGRVGGDEMTPRQREFCLKLISDESRQRLILNMHTLCWQDAKTVWDRWDDLDRTEKRDAIDLCALAASLAIVVHFPFRSSTVTQLTLGGRTPDISLPERSGKVLFSVSPDHMKNSVSFEGLLEDNRESQPRKILDWFIAGPRLKLLESEDILTEKQRKPERLLAGLDTVRYGKVLSTWTMGAGMRMTTHSFRHAIATILINLCAASLEDVTRMLGNKSTDIVARHYVFIDGVKRRKEALERMAEHRRRLGALKNLGRRKDD